jgi:hypothetical protein
VVVGVTVARDDHATTTPIPNETVELQATATVVVATNSVEPIEDELSKRNKSELIVGCSEFKKLSLLNTTNTAVVSTAINSSLITTRINEEPELPDGELNSLVLTSTSFVNNLNKQIIESEHPISSTMRIQVRHFALGLR